MVKQGWNSLGRFKFEVGYKHFVNGEYFCKLLLKWSRLKDSVLSSFLQPNIVVILSFRGFPLSQNINMLSRNKQGQPMFIEDVRWI
jgi:hypothetical protein